MKIVLTVEQVYLEQSAIIERLKDRVDKLITGIKKPSWHYYSRIKERESYALKLETGRVSDPKGCEDFFACTLVVENLSQVHVAHENIHNKFDIIEKRPNNSNFTHKDPSSFQFDDLRLYIKLRQVEGIEPTPLDNIVFELQIKTFLQHAWGIATHDLIYKSETINWPKERVAYQIKAMLEQAETMISGIDKIIEIPELAKENATTKALNKIIEMLKSTFPSEELPKDLNRLARITYDLKRNLHLEIDAIKEAIDKESEQGRGTNLRNLSPYFVVTQCLINQRTQVVQDYINKPNQKYKLFITPELDVSKLDLMQSLNCIFLKA
ncbi:hypothetical protein [Spirosoma areae]